MQPEGNLIHSVSVYQVNSTLEELHLQKFQIRDFGATRLAENLMLNMSLQYLDLSW